jgi:hypothetical protein
MKSEGKSLCPLGFVAEKLTHEHGIQEGLTACEIELLHPGFFQELHSALGLV